ncbi:MAG: homocysteine S-methyltransferase family protein [Planctomycetia bacterium]|nr:homocysteine S-methyltransferase family protein [Planctomycetia bacterium]
MYSVSYHAERIASLLATFQKSVVIFDGAMGTELYRVYNFFTNRCYDELNLSEAKKIEQIHQSYLEAGAEVLTTNTTGANTLMLNKYGLADRMEAINRAGVRNARGAIAQYVQKNPSLSPEAFYMAGSVGGLADEVSSEKRVAAWQEQVEVLLDSGVDFILFETLTSLQELEDSVEAIRRVEEKWGEKLSGQATKPSRFQAPAEGAGNVPGSSIPFMLSFRPFGGAKGEKKSATLKILSRFVKKLKKENGPRPFAWGLNCGLGPDEILEPVEEVLGAFDVPWVIQPNEGVPRKVENRSISMTSPEFFTTYVMRYVNLGAKGVGGCCGITPEHIREMAKSVKPLASARLSEVNLKELATDVVLRDEIPLAERSELGKRLAAGRWVTSVELVPPAGFDLSGTVEKCRQLKELGVLCVNVPDGPRASCRISAMVTADRIQREVGLETVLHVCCRDRNLIGMQADLLGCAACRLYNLLFITGDPPKLGDYPDATGVFDTDSIGLTKMQKRLNQGVDLSGKQLPGQSRTQSVVGVGLDPTALDRNREIDRFFKKVEAGADFAITQPVFDGEVLLEILEQVKPAGIPILAGIWPLASYRNAAFLQKEVPGVNIPDSIMTRMEKAVSKEAQIAEGIQIARESVSAIRDHVAGIQVSAPFGRVDIVAQVLEGIDN